MGHGALIRTENSVEEFYFPPFVPESPQAPVSFMLKSQSDSALPKDRSSPTKLPSGAVKSPSKGVTSDAGADESRSPHHGNVIAQATSPAYQNVRKQLFPPEQL